MNFSNIIQNTDLNNFREKVREYNEEDTTALDTNGKKKRNKRGKV